MGLTASSHHRLVGLWGVAPESAGQMSVLQQVFTTASKGLTGLRVCTVPDSVVEEWPNNAGHDVKELLSQLFLWTRAAETTEILTIAAFE